jgi:hypothetical protein
VFVQFDAITDELKATVSHIDLDDDNNSILSQISIDSTGAVDSIENNNNAETSNNATMVTDEELEAAVTAVIQQQQVCVCLLCILLFCHFSRRHDVTLIMRHNNRQHCVVASICQQVQ